MTTPNEEVVADPYEGNTEPDPNEGADVHPVLGPGEIRDSFGNVRKATADEIGNVGFGATLSQGEDTTTTTSTATARTTSK